MHAHDGISSQKKKIVVFAVAVVVVIGIFVVIAAVAPIGVVVAKVVDLTKGCCGCLCWLLVFIFSLVLIVTEKLSCGTNYWCFSSKSHFHVLPKFPKCCDFFVKNFQDTMKQEFSTHSSFHLLDF